MLYRRSRPPRRKGFIRRRDKKHPTLLRFYKRPFPPKGNRTAIGCRLVGGLEWAAAGGIPEECRELRTQRLEGSGRKPFGEGAAGGGAVKRQRRQRKASFAQEEDGGQPEGSVSGVLGSFRHLEEEGTKSKLGGRGRLVQNLILLKLVLQGKCLVRRSPDALYRVWGRRNSSAASGAASVRSRKEAPAARIGQEKSKREN